MMNSQPQHIQKREIVECQKLNMNTNLKKRAILFNKKMPLLKDSSYS